MPNIQSAKKRVKVTEKKTLRNRMVKSSVRTSIKKLEAAIAAAPKNAAVQLNETTSALDKAVAKGIIHKNAANRKKARLATQAEHGCDVKPLRICENLFLPWEGDFSHFGVSMQGGRRDAALYGGASCGDYLLLIWKRPEAVLCGQVGLHGTSGDTSGPRPERLQAGSEAGGHGTGNCLLSPMRPLGLRIRRLVDCGIWPSAWQTFRRRWKR